MASEIVKAIKAIEAESGQTIIITSAYRSDAEQAKLYSEYKQGLRAGPVAPPGSSNHRTGFAIDVAAASRPILLKYGPKHGLYNLKGDPPHFDLGAKPGLFPQLYEGAKDLLLNTTPPGIALKSAGRARELAQAGVGGAIVSYLDEAVVQPFKEIAERLLLILIGVALLVVAFREQIADVAGRFTGAAAKAAVA